MGPHIKHQQGEERDRESSPPPGDGGDSGKIRRRLIAKEFADQGAGKEHDASKAKETGDEVKAIRGAGFAGETKDVGGPGLGESYGGRREQNADVGGPGNDDVLNRRIALRDEIGGVRLEAGMFELPDDDAGIGNNLGNTVE